MLCDTEECWMQKIANSNWVKLFFYSDTSVISKKEMKQKTTLPSNEVLELSGRVWGGVVSEYDTFFRALLSEFIKENTEFLQSAKSCQGWTVRWLYCSISRSQKIFSAKKAEKPAKTTLPP